LPAKHFAKVFILKEKSLVMQTNEKECELFGALLGDGYVSLAGRKYNFGFTGDPVKDKDYFDYLSNLIFSVCGKKVCPKVRARGVRLSVYSKRYCLHLINNFNFFVGAGKAIQAKLPDFVLEDKDLFKSAVRGLFDTDGSVFCSKKPGVEKYPSLELTTSSIVLAGQVRERLLGLGFRVTKVRSYFSKLSKHRTYKVCMHGKTNLVKWVNEIGFSNPTKLAKACSLL
jgi:intein/homing endonuclease